MTSGDDDYATPDRLAIYLEIGWSDYLFGTPQSTCSGEESTYPSPRRHRVFPDFPISAVKLARQWTKAIALKPSSVCDVGGATGRAVFELDKRFPDLERLALLEPSKRFCDWATRLLSCDDTLPEVPSVDRIGAPQWVAPVSKPRPIARACDRLSIINVPLESYSPERGFDVVSCFNVIDRHPNPPELLQALERLMNDGGLLLLSSPFDFRVTSTPDPAFWIDDLNVLFRDTASWSHIGEDELFYEYRLHNRSWTRLCAQVVAKRWCP